MRQRLVPLFSAVGIALFSGCSGDVDELPRQEVSGVVSLDDVPLAHGYIQFQPVSDPGVGAGGNVTDGKYAIDRDQGPVPGEYKVLISSTPAPDSAEPAAELPPPGDPTPPPAEPIPAKYNSKSTLTATVEADKPNTFEFPLKSK